jgi:hypothetical protein
MCAVNPRRPEECSSHQTWDVVIDLRNILEKLKNKTGLASGMNRSALGAERVWSS